MGYVSSPANVDAFARSPRDGKPSEGWQAVVASCPTAVAPWNTTHGAVHLTHPAVTLQAQVVLTADATVLRTMSGDALIHCAGYGDVNRSDAPLTSVIQSGDGYVFGPSLTTRRTLAESRPLS